jgi:excisionase family DNA binding protein
MNSQGNESAPDRSRGERAAGSTTAGDADADAFLTVAEVAQVLKLNQQTVRNWIDRGELPAVRVGRRVRIRRADFERLLAAGYQPAPRTAPDNTGPSADDFWGGNPVGVAEAPPPNGHPATQDE